MGKKRRTKKRKPSPTLCAVGQKQSKRDVITKIGYSMASCTSYESNNLSNTESASRLTMKSDNETSNNELAEVMTIAKANGSTQTASLKTAIKQSDLLHESDSGDDENFAGFSFDDLNQANRLTGYCLRTFCFVDFAFEEAMRKRIICFCCLCFLVQVHKITFGMEN